MAAAAQYQPSQMASIRGPYAKKTTRKKPHAILRHNCDLFGQVLLMIQVFTGFCKHIGGCSTGATWDRQATAGAQTGRLRRSDSQRGTSMDYGVVRDCSGSELIRAFRPHSAKRKWLCGPL